MKKKVITLKVKVDRKKIPNPMHLSAQIAYPALVQEDRTKYSRKRTKKETKKLVKEYYGGKDG